MHNPEVSRSRRWNSLRSAPKAAWARLSRLSSPPALVAWERSPAGLHTTSKSPSSATSQPGSNTLGAVGFGIWRINHFDHIPRFHLPRTHPHRFPVYFHLRGYRWPSRLPGAPNQERPHAGPYPAFAPPDATLHRQVKDSISHHSLVTLHLDWGQQTEFPTRARSDAAGKPEPPPCCR